MAFQLERRNAAELSLYWCARRTLPFTPVINGETHWLTEMIHFFAHSLLSLIDILVPFSAKCELGWTQQLRPLALNRPGLRSLENKFHKYIGSRVPRKSGVFLRDNLKAH